MTDQPTGRMPEGTDVPAVLRPVSVEPYVEPDIEVEAEQPRIDEGDPDNPQMPEVDDAPAV